MLVVSEEYETWRRVRQAIRRDQPVEPDDVPEARVHVGRATAAWRMFLPAAAALLIAVNIVMRIARGSASMPFLVVEGILLLLCALAVLPWLRVRRWQRRHPLP